MRHETHTVLRKFSVNVQEEDGSKHKGDATKHVLYSPTTPSIGCANVNGRFSDTFI